MNNSSLDGVRMEKVAIGRSRVETVESCEREVEENCIYFAEIIKCENEMSKSCHVSHQKVSFCPSVRHIHQRESSEKINFNMCHLHCKQQTHYECDSHHQWMTDDIKSNERKIWINGWRATMMMIMGESDMKIKMSFGWRLVNLSSLFLFWIFISHRPSSAGQRINRRNDETRETQSSFTFHIYRSTNT